MAHKKYAYIIMSARIWGSIPHVAFCFGLRKNLKSQSPHTLLVDSLTHHEEFSRSPSKPVAQCKVIRIVNTGKCDLNLSMALVPSYLSLMIRQSQ